MGRLIALLVIILSAACSEPTPGPAAPSAVVPPAVIVTVPAPAPTAPSPPRLAVTSVLAFGDSITAGLITDANGAGVVDAAAAYPTQLFEMLKNAYASQAIAVANAGQVGETAVVGATRLPAELAVRHPDLVLLVEGINDIHGSIGDASIGPALDAIAAMIDEARGVGAAVMVGTLLPAVPGALKPGTVALIPQFNTQLAAVAAAHGATLVDLYAALEKNVAGWIGPDGLHPTAAGYQEVARVFFDDVSQRFQPQASSPKPEGVTGSAESPRARARTAGR